MRIHLTILKLRIIFIKTKRCLDDVNLIVKFNNIEKIKLKE